MIRDSKGRFIKGHFIPEKWVEMNRKSHLGRKYSDDHKRKISEGNKGKTYTLEQRLNYSLSKLGDKNPMYINGKYSRKTNKYIRELLEYKLWRKSIFERDNYMCQDCNIRGGYLEAHHKIPFVYLIEDFLQFYNLNNYSRKDILMKTAIKYNPFWEIGNGITYCRPCHIKNDLRLGGS